MKGYCKLFAHFDIKFSFGVAFIAVLLLWINFVKSLCCDIDTTTGKTKLEG